MKRTITQTVQVHITKHASVDIRDIASGDVDVSKLTFVHLDYADMSDYGWTRIGTATVSVEIEADVNQIVSSKIDVIKGQIQQVYAAAEMKVKEFKEEISKLQSIGYTASETDSVSEHGTHIVEIDAGVYTDIVINNAKGE